MKITLEREYYVMHREIFKWCEEQFGVDETRWKQTMMFGYQNYWFVNEEDATLFMLRWL